MIWYALVSVFSGSINSILEKDFFERNRRRGDQGVVAYLFLLACILQTVFLGFLFESSFSLVHFDVGVLVLLFTMCFVAALSNGLYYYGLPKEGLSEIQPFIVASPLVTIFLASAIYPDERNVIAIFLACIAVVALLGAHIKGAKIRLDAGLVPIALSVVVYSVEVLMTKYLLEYFSPVLLYTIRTGMIALFFFIYFRPSPRLLLRQRLWKVVALPAIWIVTVGALYYSYQSAGIVETLLVLMLSPILTVLGSHFILQEKEIRKQDIISLVIIMLCVAALQFINR